MGKITTLEHLRALATASKGLVNSLVGNVISSVADALDEMDAAKMDKPNAVSIAVPVTGWQSDSNASYPKYYDVAATGITVLDRADITLAVSSLGTAKACGLCPTSETLTGIIRIRAKSVPSASILAEYWIEIGKE